MENLNALTSAQNNVKRNEQWENFANAKRIQKLSKLSYLTTNSLVGGDKFTVENFKNSIYQIEFMEDYAKQVLTDGCEPMLNKIEKSCQKKLFGVNSCYESLKGM